LDFFRGKNREFEVIHLYELARHLILQNTRFELRI
jgi:hypothetical protein